MQRSTGTIRASQGYGTPVAATTSTPLSGYSESRRAITFGFSASASGTNTAGGVYLANRQITSIADKNIVLAVPSYGLPVTISGPMAKMEWHIFTALAGFASAIEDLGDDYGENTRNDPNA